MNALEEIRDHCKENVRLRARSLAEQVSRLEELAIPHTLQEAIESDEYQRQMSRDDGVPYAPLLTPEISHEHREQARRSMYARQLQRVQGIEDQLARWTRWLAELDAAIELLQ